ENRDGEETEARAAVALMAHEKRADFFVVDVINEGTSFSTAGRMAAVIVEMKKKHGMCMPQDLNAKGFTSQEVVDHWDAAHFLIAINNLSSWGRNDGQTET
ncbi:MAG: hypothetical protein KGI97_03230, partial [Alphaproteobacteria bacterium]|nr:hypothetical protein [Alphaproteobacteria bacterium]